MSEQARLVLRVDLEERYLARLRAEFPQAEFVVCLTPESLREALADATAIIGGSSISAEELAAAPRLRWIQATMVGAEGFLIAELRARPIVLTNFSGIPAPNIADHVLALVLAFARGLRPLLQAQDKHAWPEQDTHVWPGVGEPPTFEPTGQTLGLVGLGEIGRATADKAHALGMRVLATDTHREDQPPSVERVLSPPQLPLLLAESDHVVLCLPLTDATRGLVGARELRAMRRSAYLYNVGRGEVVDQDALIAALQAGVIAGAGLDVVTPEPLPPDSPLWDMPNVIITGHTATNTPLYWERGIELLLDNVRRFLAGAELRNTVDTQAGF